MLEQEHPSIEQIEAMINARHSLLSHGYEIGRFIKTHIVFEEKTSNSGKKSRQMRISGENPISPEIAKNNLPAFMELDEKVRAEGVNLDLRTTIGCTSEELGSIALFLADMANLPEFS